MLMTQCYWPKESAGVTRPIEQINKHNAESGLHINIKN